MKSGERGQRAFGIILIIALSGFLMGFDGSLFTGAVNFVTTTFELSEFQLGWLVGSHTLAATVSIFLAGPLADRFGRRTVVRAAAVVFAASAAVAAFSTSYFMLIFARLLSGLGVGAVLVASPMYIAEISRPAIRGRMITAYQLFVVFGILLAFSSNYLIVRVEELHLDWLDALSLKGENWRWMIGVGVLPAVIYLFALFFVPESPRWHAMHGRIEAARKILTRAHGAGFAEGELRELGISLARETGTRDATLRDLWNPLLKGVLIIGLVVGVLQQITGINSVLAYANVIFGEAAGATATDDISYMQTMLVGLVNFAATVVALLLIDRVGRRPLMIWGTAGMTLSLLMTAYGFHAEGGAINPGLVLVGLLSFVGCFALSLGPVMWVLLSEIFPNRVRAVAISFVGLVNSTVCFGVQFIFPWEMANLGGGGTFLIYAAFALLGLVLLVRMLPETRGRSLEQLEESLVGHEKAGEVR